MLLVSALLLASQTVQPPSAAPRPSSRATAWVAFSADLKITHPTRPEQYGRYLRDEHGCMRRETVHPDGSAIIGINNYQQQKFYQLLRGSWTVQPMRIGPMAAPTPPQPQAGGRKTDPIEGFDAYVVSTAVRSPRGDYTSERTIIPALNNFDAVQTFPNGDTITAFNIRLGAPDHSEFEPPKNAVLAERPGYGGFLSFQALDVRVEFPGRAPQTITVTEEEPAAIRTPFDETVALVVAVVDEAKGLVRVRVMKNARRVRPGTVEGEILDQFEAALGTTAKSTRLAENFSLTVTRIGLRRAQ